MQRCLACHPSVHPIVGIWGPMGLCLQQIPEAPWLGHVHVRIVLEQHGVIGHVLVTEGLAMHLLVCIIAVNNILHAGHVHLCRSIGAWHKQGAWSKLQAQNMGLSCCVIHDYSFACEIIAFVYKTVGYMTGPKQDNCHQYIAYIAAINQQKYC